MPPAVYERMRVRGLVFSILISGLSCAISAAPAPDSCVETYRQSPYVFLDLLTQGAPNQLDDNQNSCPQQAQVGVPHVFNGGFVALPMYLMNSLFSESLNLEFSMVNQSTQLQTHLNYQMTDCKISESGRIFVLNIPTDIAEGNYFLKISDESQAYCTDLTIKLVVTMAGIVSGNGADSPAFLQAGEPTSGDAFVSGTSAEDPLVKDGSIAGCRIGADGSSKGVLILILGVLLLGFFVRKKIAILVH